MESATMDTRDVMLSAKHIDYMKHAIGYRREDIKRGKYQAYRNYFTTVDRDPVWEYLCDYGLAKRHDSSLTGVLYIVMPAGIRLLADITGIQILEAK